MGGNGKLPWPGDNNPGLDLRSIRRPAVTLYAVPRFADTRWQKELKDAAAWENIASG